VWLNYSTSCIDSQAIVNFQRIQLRVYELKIGVSKDDISVNQTN
jgi:hypothetical protein